MSAPSSFDERNQKQRQPQQKTGGGGGGLVKQLLFPSYADSGSNDAFGSAAVTTDDGDSAIAEDAADPSGPFPSSADEFSKAAAAGYDGATTTTTTTPPPRQNSTTNDGVEGIIRRRNDGDSHSNDDGDDDDNNDTGSQATTAVHENLSRSSALLARTSAASAMTSSSTAATATTERRRRPRPPKALPPHDNLAANRTASTDVENDTTTDEEPDHHRSSFCNNSHRRHHHHRHQHHQTQQTPPPPSFFASTRPKSPPAIKTTAREKATTTTTTTTTATAAAYQEDRDQGSSSGADNGNEKEADNDGDDKAITDNNNNDTEGLSDEEDGNDADTPKVPVVELLETPPPLLHPRAAAKVHDVGTERETEGETTSSGSTLMKLLQRRSVAKQNQQQQRRQSNATISEEQVANVDGVDDAVVDDQDKPMPFEKEMLLYRRNGGGAAATGKNGNNSVDASSDVLSTASEMGTVINISSRLADLEEDIHRDDDEEDEHELEVAQHRQQQRKRRYRADEKDAAEDVDDEDHDDVQEPPPPPSTPRIHNHSSKEFLQQQKLHPSAAEVESLSLPSLDRNNSNSDNASGNGSGGFKSLADDDEYEFDEKKIADGEHRARSSSHSTPTRPAAAVPSSPGGILSAAIRRIGSGLTGGATTAAPAASGSPSSSLSAPNTPRSGVASLPPNSSSPSNARYFDYNLSRNRTSPGRHHYPQQDHYVRQYQRQPNLPPDQDQQHPPTSFLLRSPGSSARVAAKKASKFDSRRRRVITSPRFTSSFGRIPEEYAASSNTADDAVAIASPTRSTSSSTNPLVMARACFSFDAYDTSMDEMYEIALPTDECIDTAWGNTDGGQHHQHRPRNQRLYSPNRIGRSNSSRSHGSPAHHRALRHQQLLIPSRSAKSTSTQPLFRASSSWDIASSAAANSVGASPHGASAFRNSNDLQSPSSLSLARNHPPYVPDSPPRAHHRLSASGIHRIHRTGNNIQYQQCHSSAWRGTAEIASPPRFFKPPGSIASDFQSPQRLEIEREDALDILACLVERGISMKDSAGDTGSDECKRREEDGFDGTDEKKTSKTEEGGEKEDVDKAGRKQVSRTSSSSAASISEAIRQLQELSSGGELTDVDPDAHQRRLQALQELLRSHEYALEMRRVSKSASSWLQSIGRSSVKNDSKHAGAAAAEDVDRKDAAQVDEAANSEAGDSCPSGGDNVSSDPIELLAARALLHSARIEASEKSELAERLNAELAKCRAEIGRLRSASSAGGPFRSPNRSILDESDDTTLSAAEGDESIDRSFDNTSPIPESKDDSQCLDSSYEDIIPLRQDKSDLRKFQSALEEANEMIRKLHADLKQAKGVEDVPDEPPIVKLDDVAAKPVAASTSTGSPSNKEERMVNVRMLDGENYVTEWDELRPALPPCPDHALRSPIVAAVLEQWTDDSSLHESLLSWIDDVLAGEDPAKIPPLTLSSLNHQVRDGFVMHVLPLLLRRHDIRLDVQTRAHRQTTYDLNVSVDQVMGAFSLPGSTSGAAEGRIRPSSLDMCRHLDTVAARSDAGGADSTTHSAATALISNHSSNRVFFPDDPRYDEIIASSTRLSYDEVADGVGPQQTGLMSALGGALGGLLARRKSGVGGADTPAHEAMQTIIETPAAAASAAADGGASAGTSATPRTTTPYHADGAVGSAGGGGGAIDDEDEEDGPQPYHRVVAAPPGRLYITFVEYRGHAMVSDVHEDSPLVGWIFPSDILIAIDELPVSGMRVRDIIKVLKDRTGRQRALRVISSHDMNELTLNMSATHDG